MGNVVHMRDFRHGYSHLYRHALRGKPKVNVWAELAAGCLWLAAYALMVIDTWLFGLCA